MRLLVLSSWWPCPPDNGSRLRAFHLLRRLSRRHEITLIAFGTPREPADIEPLHACCARVIAVEPTPVPASGLGPRGLLSPTPRSLVQTESPAMRAHARALAPAHDVAIGLQLGAARYLAETPGLPRIFEEVEVTAIRERWASAPHGAVRLRYGLTWWKARRFIRGVVRAMDRATVVSHLEREALVAMGCARDRIEVVPNGVEVSAASRVETASQRLIYPGSVLFDANLDAVRYFIHEVFPRIRQARPDIAFWVTGATDGVDVTDLRQPGVIFTGRLADIEGAIAGSAACVIPLRAGGGTRLKVLQSMALGVPVVSTPKGVEGLDVDAESHVLVGRTAEDLARETLRVLDDRELAGRLADAARGLVRERYDWDRIAEALDQVIHDAVEAFHTSLRRQPRQVAPVPDAR
jgi:glycosyltransferase involved in cell wall biosynthesis